MSRSWITSWRTVMTKVLLGAGVLLLALVAVTPSRAADHPFLLVREADYPALRARAATSPWREMKAAAIADVTTLRYDPAEPSVEDKALRIRDIVSAGTLAYLLDPEQQAVYLDQVRAGLQALEDLDQSRSGNYWDWAMHVPVACAAFNAILALDILYDVLDAEERATFEGYVDRIVSDLNTDAWTLSAYAAKGTWALYQGDRAAIDQHKAAYRVAMDDLLTESGLFNGGTGYATSRFTKHAREQKFLFMDVLEHTGEGTWYEDPRLQTLYEWMFAHVYAPFASIFVFGDAKLGTSARRRLNQSAATYRAHRFSEQAGRHAAWHVREAEPAGRLTLYLLADRAPEPERPDVSRVYEDGGAWLVHNPSDDAAFFGALWNARSASSHSHKEVNALNLAAYGEFLVVNSGYNNWGNGGLGFSWAYIHDTAYASNTVLINHQDHSAKTGAGISEGFVDETLHYASGHSGTALRDGTHERSLVFVPPGDGTAGYWVLFDEVEADAAPAQASVALHPYAPAATTEAEGQAYRWDVQRWRDTPVSLTAFLGTPPDNVQLLNGLLADKSRSIVGKYLYATYPTDAAGRAQVVTVLFPHDAAHPRAEMERLAGDRYTGARVRFGAGGEDVALESSGTAPVTLDGFTMQARALLYRRQGEALTFYFARHGTFFDDGAGRGFSAAAPVSLVLRGREGTLVSPGTDVTFHQPGITAVRFEGVPAPVIDQGDGWITVSAAAGTYDVALAVDAATARSEPEPLPDRFILHGAYPNPFNPSTTVRFDLPEAAQVHVEVFDLLGRQVLATPPQAHASGAGQAVRLDAGRLAAGVYLYRVMARGAVQTYTATGQLVLIP